MERTLGEDDLPYKYLDELQYVEMMAKLSIDEFEPPQEWFKAMFRYKSEEFFILRDKGENYVIYLNR